MGVIDDELRKRLADRLVVASVSGGKDSTAMALWLREQGIPHVRVFADTGFEAPETYEYLDQLRERLGDITVVRNQSLWDDAAPDEGGMLTLIRRKRMFPSRLMRFCTQQLKLIPIRDHVRRLQDAGAEVVNAVGVRAEESAARARMPVWEFWDEVDADIWRPMLAWREQDVIDIHRRHDLRPNPLYLQGARRVGCSPCIFASKPDLRHLPETQLVRIRRVERDLTEDATRRSCERPTRALLQIRGPEGLRFAPIDEVIARAHLHRGAPIDIAAQPAGCVRWGLCEGADASASEAVATDPGHDARTVPAPHTEPSTSEDAPTRRRIGHDHLIAMGFAAEMVADWLATGRLLKMEWPGFYTLHPELERDLDRLATRRRVGRGHLMTLGVTTGVVERWRRHGLLKTTAHRGFYDISVGLFERVAQASSTTNAEVQATQEAATAVETQALTSPVPLAPVKLNIIACTIRRAQEFVGEHHRHLRAPVGGLFAVGLAQAGQLVGVAIVGRPVARRLQDGTTAEVTRVCTTGERNGCSMLLAACRRGALALGYRRVITYTLETEPGSSLRGAGWQQVATVRGASWTRRSRPRGDAPVIDKRRWEATCTRVGPPRQHHSAA